MTRANAPIIDLIDLGMTSWLVIMLRSAQLAATPLPLAGRDAREVERMVAEKAQAWFEGVNEVTLLTSRTYARAAEAGMRMAFVPTLASWQSAAALTATGIGAAAQAGLRPYRRRSRANVRRLSRG